jgi:hypothetical protein
MCRCRSFPGVAEQMGDGGRSAAWVVVIKAGSWLRRPPFRVLINVGRLLVGRRMNYAARAPHLDVTSELAGYEVQYVLGEPLTGGGVDDA